MRSEKNVSRNESACILKIYFHKSFAICIIHGCPVTLDFLQDGQHPFVQIPFPSLFLFYSSSTRQMNRKVFNFFRFGNRGLSTSNESCMYRKSISRQIFYKDMVLEKERKISI